MDLEAFAPGVLRKVLVHDGETVQSGKLIAVIAEADEDIASALSDGVTAAASTGTGPKSAPSTDAAASVSSGRPRGERVLASPRAKALAAERGVELSTLTGTGPGGRIVEDDVTAASASVAHALATGISSAARAGGASAACSVSSRPPSASARMVSSMRRTSGCCTIGTPPCTRCSA